MGEGNREKETKNVFFGLDRRYFWYVCFLLTVYWFLNHKSPLIRKESKRDIHDDDDDSIKSAIPSIMTQMFILQKDFFFQFLRYLIEWLEYKARTIFYFFMGD